MGGSWVGPGRVLVLALILAAHAAAAIDDEADTPEPEPAADVDKPTEPAAEEAAAEPIVLNCKAAELIEPIDTWSVDCVAQWLDNMGFAELKSGFIGNGVDGPQLREMTQAKLADDYGVSEEESRKKLVYALKDVVKKDSYKGNTNNWAQFFMWVLPFLAVYKWLTVRYDRQITKMKKKYQKWHDARNPVEEPPPATADATNEWIKGVNADVGVPTSGGDKKKKEKRLKKAD